MRYNGIYSQRNHDNIYEQNRITIFNQEPTGHDDCIQLFEDTSTVVRGNLLVQDNDKSGNAQGLYATTMHGTSRFYNNVINLNNAQSNGLSFRRLTGTGTVEIYGNTVFSIRAYHTAEVTETPDPVVKNNIFVATDVETVFFLTGWAGDPGNIDHNLYFSPRDGAVASVNGSGRRWAEWQAAGFDGHGVHDDPRFEDLAGRDFHLAADSPAIDAGSALGAPYDVDQEGRSRPRGDGWDIGAYER